MPISGRGRPRQLKIDLHFVLSETVTVSTSSLLDLLIVNIVLSLFNVVVRVESLLAIAP